MKRPSKSMNGKTIWIRANAHCIDEGANLRGVYVHVPNSTYFRFNPRGILRDGAWCIYATIEPMRIARDEWDFVD